VAVPDREPWTVRVDPEVRAAWREQIDEWDGENPGHVGYHLEQAMKEYIDVDRTSRRAAAHTHTRRPRDRAPSSAPATSTNGSRTTTGWSSATTT